MGSVCVEGFRWLNSFGDDGSRGRSPHLNPTSGYFGLMDVGWLFVRAGRGGSKLPRSMGRWDFEGLLGLR